VTTPSDLQAQLATAANRGYLSACIALVEQGADVNFADKDQFTPLHEAAQGGSAEVCRFLIEQGAKLDAQDHTQMTPLHQAARDNNAAAAAVLIDAGAPLDAPGFEGRTPLFQAALYGSSDALGVLIKKGANVEASSSFHAKTYLQAFNTQRRTPLHAAALEGDGGFRTANRPDHLACARQLIEAGAKVEAAERLKVDTRVVASFPRYDLDLTPLDHVQTPDMAHLLIDNGANLAGTGGWHAPFRSAIEKRHRDVAATLVGAGYEPTENDWQAFDEGTLETRAAFSERCGRLKAERLEKRLAVAFYDPGVTVAQHPVRHASNGAEQGQGMRVRF